MDERAQLIWWRLRRAARTLGWAGGAGALLLVFAGIFFLTEVVPLQGSNLELRERVAALGARLQGQHGERAPSRRPGAQLDMFYESLAGVGSVAAVLYDLNTQARAAGLSLDSGEYRPVTASSGRLVRYQIVLPVVGRYGQLKEFLGRVLRKSPGVALDAVEFRRSDPRSEQLETELRFTVFLRAAA